MCGFGKESNVQLLSVVFVAAMLILGLQVTTARAELVAYDGFDYRESPLANQDGGYGWRIPWYKDSVDTVSDLTVQPFYNLDMANYTLGTDMGCLTITAAQKGVRAFESRWPLSMDATYYMSWIVEPRANSYVIWKIGYLGSTVSERMTVTWSAGKVGIQIRNNGTLTAKVYSADNSSPVFERRLIVIKVVAHQDAPDEMFLKLYAPGDTMDTDDANVSWDATVSGSDDYFVDAVGIICSSSATTYMDEFRAGTEWIDVVPGASGLAYSEPLSGVNQDPDLLAYDGFFYEGLKLGNGNGGFGWTGPWYADPNLPVSGQAFLEGPCPMDLTANKMPDTDNLLFEPVGGMVLEAVDSKPADALNPDDNAYRYLSEAAQVDMNVNSNYYISFLLRREDSGASVSSEYCSIKLAQRGTDDFYDKIKLSVGSDEEFRFSLWDSSEAVEVQTPPSAPGSFSVMTTYFCVIKIAAQDATEGNYDQLSVKFYTPADTIDISEPATWTYQSNMLANCDDVLDTLLFYCGRAAVMLFDELRVGKTWASVVNPVQGCGFPGLETNPADLDKDCSVDMTDFGIFAENWLD